LIFGRKIFVTWPGALAHH